MFSYKKYSGLINKVALKYYMQNFDFHNFKLDDAFRWGSGCHELHLLIQNSGECVQNFFLKQNLNSWIGYWKSLLEGIGSAIHIRSTAMPVRDIYKVCWRTDKLKVPFMLSHVPFYS